MERLLQFTSSHKNVERAVALVGWSAIALATLSSVLLLIDLALH